MPYEHQPIHGTQVYVASATDPEAPGVTLVRQIGPQGATGKLIPVRTSYAEPIGGGKMTPVSTAFARRIGPKGAYGPLIPLGDVTQHSGAVLAGIGLLALVVIFLSTRETPADDWSV
jgi:hypothetical protein